MWWRYVLFRPPFALLARTRKYHLKVEGAENVPHYGPFMVVANHQSSIDVVAIALALKPALVRTRLWPWAKTEIAEGKEGLMGRFLWKVFGVIPIDREEGSCEEAIMPSLDRLRRGEAVLIYPEGTRHRNRELGWFRYGVANLARAAPAPILPVSFFRRDEDGGITVRIGKLFLMPEKKMRYEALEALEDRVEERVSTQIDSLRQWSGEVPRDKKGMGMIANMINMIVERLSRQEMSFDRFCRMAEAEDNEFIRDRVFELLPENWSKVEPPDFRKAGATRDESAPSGDSTG
jgi:1-acyl-sn-glycerol-3-phosphate acyltransferase